MENVNIQNDAEMPIYPTWYTQNGEESHRPLREGEKTNYEYFNPGLTKREYFAAMAMQGLMAFDPMMYGRKVMAEYCVDMADALIRQLNIKDFNP